MNESGKKILIISLNIPYPLIHGGAVAQYFFLEQLSAQHRITFCSYAYEDQDVKALESLRSAVPGIQVIYEVNKRPHKPSFFEKAVRRVQREFNADEEQPKELRQLSYETFPFILDENFVSFIQAHLRREIYDVIQIEFFECLSLLPLLPAEAKKIYICHEIKAKRLSRLVVSKRYEDYKNYIVEMIRQIEGRFISLVNQVVVFTVEDQQYLRELNCDAELSPYGIPEALITRKQPSGHFSRFVFTGKEAFWPNYEGLKWFLDSVYLPNLNKIHWPVYILGDWSEEFRSMYKHPSIHFEGFVDAIDSYLENSVLLAPILSGSGLRTKILQAYANYVPVMATGFAAEGLAGDHLLVFDDSAQFTDHFNRIFHDSTILQQLASRAYVFFENNFNEEHLVTIRNRIY